MTKTTKTIGKGKSGKALVRTVRRPPTPIDLRIGRLFKRLRLESGNGRVEGVENVAGNVRQRAIRGHHDSLTIYRVAADLGLSPASVSHLETGRTLVAQETMALLMDYYEAREAEWRKLGKLLAMKSGQEVWGRLVEMKVLEWKKGRKGEEDDE